jgi:hypothetical protein
MTKAAKTPDLATFWHGRLDPISYSCLASFAHAGARLSVYSYDDKIDLPPGVEWADARRICPDQSLLSRYLAAGKPSLAKFADMFRYRMIRKTGCCWVDADIVCLARPDFSRDEIVFGLQSNPYGEILVNNAVLKLPPAHPLLEALNRKAEEAVDIDQSWGAIGPFLLTELVLRQGIEGSARQSFAFYPIEPDDFWQMLSPAWRGRVAATTRQSLFLHLWGEMFERSAYDRNIAPPAGSFLHEMFERAGTLQRFQRAYDGDELAALLAVRLPVGEFFGQTAPSST